MRLRVSVPLTVLSLFVSFSSGCGLVNPSEESDEPGASESAAATSSDFETVVVGSKAHEETIELPGASVHGFETTQLMAKVGGYVKEIKTINGEEVDVGTVVKKGAELAVLDIPEMADQLSEKEALVRQANSLVDQADSVIKQRKAGIDQRNAEVKQAKAQLDEKVELLKLSKARRDRILGLIDKGRIGDENRDEVVFAVAAAEAAIAAVNADIETAEANVEAAEADKEKAEADKSSAQEHVKVTQAAVDELKTLMGYRTITAPYPGVITKRLVDHGAFVRPATSNSGAMPLFEITRIDKVRVMVSVPTVHAARVLVGQKAIVHSIGGLRGDRISAKITRTAGALDPDSRMLAIEIHLANPLKQAGSDRSISLKPGMFGSVSVIVKEWPVHLNTGEVIELAVVPTSAVGTDKSDRKYVVLVDAEGKASRQHVTVVFDDAENVGISEGVKPGKIVVLENVEQIEDGQVIPLKSQ